MEPIPLPTPFPVPPPGEGDISMAALWDYDALSGMVSSFRTVFVLAEQNFIISAFIAMALILVAVWWAARFVGDREESI